ncbi:MAG: cation-translocating P-type ATPase [Candidatus Omnitrophica bacterium]|nr:cation-translocating P-type ATPase [Candidatus Omnitrophota bacterium]
MLQIAKKKGLNTIAFGIGRFYGVIAAESKSLRMGIAITNTPKVRPVKPIKKALPKDKSIIQKKTQVIPFPKAKDLIKDEANVLVFGIVFSEVALVLTTTFLIFADLFVLGLFGTLAGAIIGGVIALFLGIPIFKKAYSCIRQRKWNLNILIAVSVLLAIAADQIIFALFVTWAIRLSISLQERNKTKMRQAIAAMMDSKDKRAWLINKDGTEIHVSVDSIRKEDTIVIHTGDKIHADGTIIEGDAAVSQAAFSGESVPVYKTIGDTVYSGTVVLEGRIIIKVTGTGMDTEIGNIVRAIESARELNAPIDSISENFARVFVPLAFGVTITAFVISGSIPIAITVLIMSAPCAVLFSTPSAIYAGIRKGVKDNIFIKGGIYLESIGKVDMLLIDKTGTLTEGKPKIVTIAPTSKIISNNEILSLAASAEYHSKHPFAAAIINEAKLKGLPIIMQKDFRVLSGRGVISKLDSGDEVIVCGKSLLKEFDIKSTNIISDISDQMKARAESVVYVIKNRKVLGLLGLIDLPREGAKETIEKLKGMGITEIAILTGDHLISAKAIADKVGIDKVYADLSPTDKMNIVEKYKNKKNMRIIAMAGEGLNDAPAMAISDVGIALGKHATDFTINESGIVILDDDLNKIVEAIHLGRESRKIIKQNYAIGLSVNVVGMLAAAAGAINPLVGVLIHEAATSLVLFNSSRLFFLNDYKKGANLK